MSPMPGQSFRAVLQVATHLRSISGEQATEWCSLEVLSNVPWEGEEGWYQWESRRALSRSTCPHPRHGTQGPGLLLTCAQPTGILEAAEKMVLLLLCVVCREASAQWSGPGHPVHPAAASCHLASSCQSSGHPRAC